MSEAIQVLGVNITKNLSDKTYEKRKQAANDIEKSVKESLQLPQGRDRVFKIQNVLIQEYIGSAYPNYRKGGLIGLASVAISIEHSMVTDVLPTLIPPVLSLFKDEESRVRYYACEAMYNIAKVAKKHTLSYFNRIFDGLCTLIADVDQEVKNGAQHLDRLVKDIVTDSRRERASSSSKPVFDLGSFIPVLTQRIRVLNPFIRQLILGWVILLQSTPACDLIVFLPQFLEGLLNMLAETSHDIRNKADACLKEFLQDLSQMPPGRQSTLIAETTRVVVKGCSHANDSVRMAAITWLNTFVGLASQAAKVHVQPDSFDTMFGEPLSDESGEAFTLLPDMLQGVLPCVDDTDENIAHVAILTHSNLQEMVEHVSWSSQDIVVGVVEVLLGEMRPTPGVVVDPQHAGREPAVENVEKSTKVRTACLQWICLLLSQKPYEMVVPSVLNRLFDPIFETLRAREVEVVTTALQVLAQIMTLGFDPSKLRPGSASPAVSALRAVASQKEPASNPDDLFRTVTTKLLQLFQEDRHMMDERGRLIIRQLCSQLDTTHFYTTVGRALKTQSDQEFGSQCVQIFNWILLSAKETRPFRELLLRKTAGENDPTLFLELLTSWFVNPISALSLCLWVQEYQLAMELTQRFAALEPTVEFLKQVDILVNLLESPIFCRTRMHLLEPKKHPCLLKTMLGLSMLLPQASCFDVLHTRLSLAQSGLLLETLDSGASAQKEPKVYNELTIRDLLDDFDKMVLR
eukprot:GEMP01016078.1.p1 GENE.GEMP01016078.1~~GEMP01016078.1.p1  ORF type:complete len:745 (+),score=143.98 GEMP01016078.1:91-2325(+)